MRCTVIGTLLVVGIVTARPSAQSQAPPKPTFEVASVKRNVSGLVGISGVLVRGNLFRVTNAR
jgi:hypothetical protein